MGYLFVGLPSTMAFKGSCLYKTEFVLFFKWLYSRRQNYGSFLEKELNKSLKNSQTRARRVSNLSPIFKTAKKSPITFYFFKANTNR
jgi:hypothetical protein